MPLSDRARRRSQHPFVFPGQNRSEPTSDMSFLMLLRRMGRPDRGARMFELRVGAMRGAGHTSPPDRTEVTHCRSWADR